MFCRDCPRLPVILLEKAFFLECFKMLMHSRCRSQSEVPCHFFERRSNAMLFDLSINKIQYLFLAFCKHNLLYPNKTRKLSTGSEDYRSPKTLEYKKVKVYPSVLKVQKD